MEYKDYYKIMGVAKSATADEIKRAYRKLARKYHPDVSKEANAEQKFKEVGEAYEVLKDPQKRAAYDRIGSHWQEGQSFTPPPDWGTGFEFSSTTNAGFSDFFESLFGGHSPFGARHQRQGQPFHAHGEDHYAKILIDLEEAYSGATRTISLQIPEVGADGQIVNKTRKLNIKIPKGIKSGQRIRLAGQGGAGYGSGKNGDLFIEIVFNKHPYFYVKNRDVYLELPITPWEAALGAVISVPTLSGKVDVKIPPNSQTKQKLRLKARGLPGMPPGDHYIILEIVTPPAKTSEARAIYEKMAKILPMNPRVELGG
ncbi:MAG: cytochrome C biogenesis protein [Gammaproteobacteria bacterium HGW-Gammaproteobacteria-10]|nr:MAG: cytochrome C biogenesis protein [Gammaproteobacteria bacterium HGW-Gammaproteobacteria-3]PKM35432.1 MAG: cytochrome C biogenesis protein [Gammaproteobacteria bacterium HGW-Gammaproteobacteria-10]